MIFTTVGTHEQQFNRLVKYMDQWAYEHEEKVFLQTGYSTYEPRWCEWKKTVSHDEVKKSILTSRIVITHGGPSSFLLPLQYGKIPIVVPRKKDYGEHVNDHQVLFCEQVAAKWKSIIVVNDIEMLGHIIEHYDEISSEMICNYSSNNNYFCAELEKIIFGLQAQ